MRKLFATARAVQAAGVLAIGLLLSGCWAQVGFGPERQRSNPNEQSLTADNVSSLQQAWFVDLATDDEPIVSDGRVFVGHGTPSTYAVRALDVATGATAWDYDDIGGAAPGFTVDAPPVSVASGQVWASYEAGNPALNRCGGVQLRIDPVDGSAARQPGRVGYPPVEADGALAQVVTEITTSPNCGGESRMLHVTPRSGPAWTYPIDDERPAGLPVITGQQVIFSVGADVLAFPLDGCGAATCAPTWTADLDGPNEQARAIEQLVVGSGKVFAVTSDPESHRAVLIALNLDGTLAWNAEVGGSDGRLALAGDRLFLVNTGTGGLLNTLQAFPASGCAGGQGCTPVWTAEIGVASLGEGPVVAGGVVYVGRSGSVVAYPVDGCGSELCSPITFFDVGGDPQGMSVSDGRLFVTTGSRLVAFAPQQSG
jgi:outer membrane protein assembly factor BamB